MRTESSARNSGSSSDLRNVRPSFVLSLLTPRSRVARAIVFLLHGLRRFQLRIAFLVGPIPFAQHTLQKRVLLLRGQALEDVQLVLAGSGSLRRDDRADQYQSRSRRQETWPASCKPRKTQLSFLERPFGTYDFWPTTTSAKLYTKAPSRDPLVALGLGDSAPWLWQFVSDRSSCAAKPHSPGPTNPATIYFAQVPIHRGP